MGDPAGELLELLRAPLDNLAMLLLDPARLRHGAHHEPGGEPGHDDAEGVHLERHPVRARVNLLDAHRRVLGLARV